MYTMDNDNDPPAHIPPCKFPDEKHKFKALVISYNSYTCTCFLLATYDSVLTIWKIKLCMTSSKHWQNAKVPIIDKQEAELCTVIMIIFIYVCIYNII